MPKDLRHFLKTVRENVPQYYAETRKAVKPEYELGVILHKLEKERRFPVLYCPEVTGSKIPLVANIYGAYDLAGLALDISPDTMRQSGRSSILEEYRRRENNFVKVREIPGADSPVQEVVLRGSQVDLGLLPIIKHAPLNSGKYVTAGMTVLRNPDTGNPNVGVYRMEVKGKDRIALMMDAWHHGGEIAQRYADLGQRRMEVVTFIGHHPVTAMAAATPTNRDVNEFEYMGALLGEPLEVTRAVTVDLPVPAFAEIAIEGFVDPKEMTTEGPFSEAAGYYGEGRPCYLVQVTAITMRHDAIYQDLHPTRESRLVGMLGRESSILDDVRKTGVDAIGVHVGQEYRCGKFVSYVSIRKRDQNDVKVAGVAALPAGPAHKFAVIVGDDIDVWDEDEVLWALASRLSDAFLITKTEKETKFASFSAGSSTGLSSRDVKLILDATRPLDKPGPKRVVLPKEVWDAIDLKEYVR